MRARLADICQSIADGDHQAPPKSSDGVPFITISCMDPNGGTLDLKSVAHVSEEYYESLPSCRVAEPGDVLLSVVGSIGIPYLVKSGDKFVFQRHIAILRPGERITPEFLYYSLMSTESTHYINSVAQGAAQRTLTLTQLRDMEINVPSLDKQRRIANVLIAYDRLIENNRRRIDLLEEAAQRLYKEWFVDLRFPGYENTPIIDGIPEGWRKATIGDFSPFKRGEVVVKKDLDPGDIPVVAGGLQPAYFSNIVNTKPPVVTVSGSGANAGFTKLYLTDIWASDCSFVDTSTTQYIYFTYLSAKVLGNDFARLQKGSAQPHVYPSDANAIEIMIPNESTLNRFTAIVGNIYSEVKDCNHQINNAREARDRLLPALMAGRLGAGQ